MDREQKIKEMRELLRKRRKKAAEKAELARLKKELDQYTPTGKIKAAARKKLKFGLKKLFS